MLAALVTTFGSCVIGALSIGVYVEATGHTPSTAWHTTLAFLRVTGWGALIGLIAGLIVMVVATWLAMATRSLIARGRGWARGVLMGLTAVLWALAVLIGLHTIGFSGIGPVAWLVTAPALVAALVAMWFLAVWVARSVTVDDRL